MTSCASQPQLVDLLVEALFQADFPDPSDVAFDDDVFEADLDTRTMTSQAGIGAGRFLDLLAAFPELENEVATAIDARALRLSMKHRPMWDRAPNCARTKPQRGRLQR